MCIRDRLYSVYKQFSNTLAACFSSNVKQAVFYAKARNYASSRQYYLSENEVPEAVYDNLVGAVRKNLQKLHHYTAVRKRLLGVDSLHMYDLYAVSYTHLFVGIRHLQEKQCANLLLCV